MTFLEEELKTLESSPDYRRFLRIFIKYQIYTLFQKLSDAGEESVALTANPSDGTFSHVGSSKGEVFLDKTQDLQWKFLSFCSSTDINPDSFQVIPVSSRDSSPHPEDTTYTEEDSVVLRQPEPRVRKKVKRKAVFRLEDVDVYKEQEDQEESVYEEQDSQDYRGEEEEYTEQEDSTNPGTFQAYVTRNTQDIVDMAPTSVKMRLHRSSNSVFPADLDTNTHIQSTDRDRRANISNIIGRHQLKQDPDGNFESQYEHKESVLHVEESYQRPDTHSEAIQVLESGASMQIKLESGGDYQLVQCPEELGYTATGEVEAYAGYIDNGRTESLNQNVVLTSRPVPNFNTVEQNVSERKRVQENYTFIGRNSKNDDKRYYSHLQFHCRECPGYFDSPAALEQHKLMHSGDKPYPCTECYKSFRLPHHLREHMRIHTGEKPYQCSVCSKAFAKVGYRNVHIKSPERCFLVLSYKCCSGTNVYI